MSIENEFVKWLDIALKAPRNDRIKAYSFNLFELYGEERGIELIGASTFDPEDPDWACEEIWRASPKSISIPEGTFSKGWEACLEGMKSIVLNYLHNGEHAKLLKQSEAVGIGFVDGDMVILWQKNA